MIKSTIRVRIARLNPTLDSAVHFQTYKVPFSPRMTVMDVLDYIYENLDHSLAHYSHTACRRRICGRCNVIVNGKATLSCQSEVTGDLTVEALPHFKIVRDLVISETDA